MLCFVFVFMFELFTLILIVMFLYHFCVVCVTIIDVDLYLLGLFGCLFMFCLVCFDLLVILVCGDFVLFTFVCLRAGFEVVYLMVGCFDWLFVNLLDLIGLND